VKEVHTVQIEWQKNEKGQFVPKEVPGTEKAHPAQLVLLAMGFLGPEQPLLEQLGVERDARSNAKADFNKYATNIKGVFAAGDARRGQSLVVGRLTKGAERRVNVIVTSWASRICLEPCNLIIRPSAEFPERRAHIRSWSGRIDPRG